MLEDHLRGRDEEHEQDDGRDDRPGDLQLAGAVHLLGTLLVAAAEAQRGVEDGRLDADEDDQRRPEDDLVQSLDIVGLLGLGCDVRIGLHDLGAAAGEEHDDSHQRQQRDQPRPTMAASRRRCLVFLARTEPDHSRSLVPVPPAASTPWPP